LRVSWPPVDVDSLSKTLSQTAITIQSPSKLPCVVLAEPRRSPENRGPKLTLRIAGDGENNRKVKSWVYPGSRPSTRIHGGRAGLVDSAREENKARAVVEIYLEPGAIPTPGLHPFDTTASSGPRVWSSALHDCSFPTHAMFSKRSPETLDVADRFRNEYLIRLVRGEMADSVRN